jgi:glucuronoarabinoxylan endo-1,4-beta-xylanase
MTSITAIKFRPGSSSWKAKARSPMLALPPARRAALAAALLLSLAGFSSAPAQTATINWTEARQIIDGFGASDAFTSASMSPADQAFFFGTKTGNIGLSLLRVAVPDASGISGSCASVSKSCAGVDVGDMLAVIANGGRVYASPWSPPAAYKTNRLITCTRNAGLNTADYAAYATWLANFVIRRQH